jgi:hypothetical protein
VSLGVLKIFPLWNKFSRPLPTVAGPALIYSSDLAGARVQQGEWVWQAQAIGGPTADDSVFLAEAAWYAEFGEFHALVARWWRLPTAGLAFAKDLGGTTVRAEGLAIDLGRVDRPDGQWQLGAGAERALSADWTLLGELLYQSQGYDHSADYPVALPSRFTPLHARAYAYLNVQYKLTPYWTLSPAALANLADASTYLIAKVLHSLSEDTDVYAEADLPFGSDGAEFAEKAFRFPTGAYVGVPVQFQAGIKTAF